MHLNQPRREARMHQYSHKHGGRTTQLNTIRLRCATSISSGWNRPGPHCGGRQRGRQHGHQQLADPTQADSKAPFSL